MMSLPWTTLEEVQARLSFELKFLRDYLGSVSWGGMAEKRKWAFFSRSYKTIVFKLFHGKHEP